MTLELGFKIKNERLDQKLVRQLTAPSKTILTVRLLYPGIEDKEPVFVRDPDDPKSIITTRWVGTISLKSSDSRPKETITVEPRIGWDGLKRLLTACLKISAPSKQSNSIKPEGTSSFRTILAVAWFYAFRQGLRRHNLVKDYYQRHEPKHPYLRGKFEVDVHLCNNLVNKEAISCTFNELTYNIPINQSLVQVVDYLKTNQIWPFCIDIGKDAAIMVNQKRDLLNTLGVNSPRRPVNPKEIRWDRRNNWFRPMVTLGHALLTGSGEGTGRLSRQALFLDMAEIWELFLLTKLQEAASESEKELTIVHPMTQRTEMDFLLYHKGKKVRGLIPDFLLCHEEELIGVIDAKYKYLHDDHRQAGVPQSGDISQMFIYQHYYRHNRKYNNQNSKRVPGALIYPQSQDLNNDICLDNNETAYCSYSYSQGHLGGDGKPPLSWWLWNIEWPGKNEENNFSDFSEKMKITASHVLDWLLSPPAQKEQNYQG